MHEIVGEVIASAHPAHDIGDLVVGWASDLHFMIVFAVDHLF
jgi:L-iditol 2-dehydrogenase